MKSTSLVVVIFLVLILASIFYVAVDHDDADANENDNNNPTNNNNEPNNQDETPPDTNENNEDENGYTHTVFIEEATATDCKNCPEIAEVLHDHLYDSNDGHFYYVSMIDDHDKASEYIHDHYNIIGFPTVFIDGGYGVILGANDFKNHLLEKCCMNNISAAVHRKVPSLKLNLTAELNENKDKINVEVFVENYENEKYNGRLKVYLTEIVSRWQDYQGKPYNFGFLDFIIDKSITIEGKSNISEEETWDVSDLDPENLMIIAVVFNSEPHKAYANPPEGNPFNAYYADEADATRVTEGKLPPRIGINTPKKYSHYIWGKEKQNKLIKTTYIIGKIPIKVNVVAESGVEKVEYTIKGPLRTIKETVTESPYTIVWKKFAFGKYTITAKIYDKEGRTSTDSIEVFAFMLGLF